MGCGTDVLFHLQIPASDRNLHGPVLFGEFDSQSRNIADGETSLEKNPVRGEWNWPFDRAGSRIRLTRSTRYPLALAGLDLSQVVHLGPPSFYSQYRFASSGLGTDSLVGKSLRRGGGSLPGQLQALLTRGDPSFLPKWISAHTPGSRSLRNTHSSFQPS